MKKRLLLPIVAIGLAVATWLRLRRSEEPPFEPFEAAPPPPPAQLGGEVDPELLAILACPLDKAPVAREGDYIVCSQCGRRYPIRDGIPVMLIEEAILPEEAPASDGQQAQPAEEQSGAEETATAEPSAKTDTAKE